MEVSELSKILAINSGSSSLKFKLFEMPAERIVASGLIERIGISAPQVTIKNADGQVMFQQTEDIPDHKRAVELLLDLLLRLKIVTSYDEIAGVGHRVVAGGEYFDHSVIVTDDVKKKIAELKEFAPLHNPANLIGIEAFERALPHAVAVACFDTAFHRTLPETNYVYSVPYEWYEKYGVRRFGAHGLSHKYVVGEAAKLMKKPLADLKLISCHLGSGASICAVKNGKSYDTSMGFSPLSGITMQTRSGDVDVSLVAYMREKLGVSMDEMIYLLNNKSGLLGISGFSPDMRDLLAQMDTNHRAKLAVDIFVKNVVKFIGQYVAEVGGIDGLIFTAGIGEASGPIKRRIMKRLAFMGITIAEDKLDVTGQDVIISGPDSKVTVMTIPTNEELVIARDVMDYLA